MSQAARRTPHVHDSCSDRRYRSRIGPPPSADLSGAAVPEADRAIDHRVGAFEVVRRHHDDRARLAELPEPRRQRRGRIVVEARERLVKQDEPRLMQERALEREPLTQSA